jgi:hypothetical protein
LAREIFRLWTGIFRKYPSQTWYICITLYVLEYSFYRVRVFNATFNNISATSISWQQFYWLMWSFLNTETTGSRAGMPLQKLHSRTWIQSLLYFVTL